MTKKQVTIKPIALKVKNKTPQKIKKQLNVI